MSIKKRYPIAEFDLGSYDAITEFIIETDGDDLYFKLNHSMDYYLGDDKFNEAAKAILQADNILDKYSIDNNRETSKLRVRVIVEHVTEEDQK